MNIKYLVLKTIEKYRKNRYICTKANTRNRYKSIKYKTDNSKCIVYGDNRCCGGCLIAYICFHCVNCNCYGFTKSCMGGTDKQYFLSGCSDDKAKGYRLKKDGTFDWEHYKILNKYLEEG